MSESQHHAIDVRVVALEQVVRSLAGFVMRSTTDPNARAYFSNTFNTAVDNLSTEGMTVEQGMVAKEQVRSHGQAVIDSILSATGGF